MIRSLGYLSLWQAREPFRDLHRLLLDRGKIVIETPDIAKCTVLCEREGDLFAYLEAMRAIYGFDMEHVRRRRHYQPYSFGWSAWHLRHALLAAGFRQGDLLAPETHGRSLWRDMRVVALQ